MSTGLLAALDHLGVGIEDRRRRAAGAVSQTGLPTKKTEAWRFTSIKPITDAVLEPRPVQPSIQIETKVPPGVDVRRLADVVESPPEALGAIVEPVYFAALNQACFTDGLWVHVSADTHVQDPLQIVHRATASTSVSYPRVLITVAQGAALTVIETYNGFEGEGDTLTNVVVEVALEPGAQLEHVRVQQDRGFHVGHVDVLQKRDSQYKARTVSFGGRLNRTDLRVLLTEPGAQCELNGAYHVDGSDHVDHHTVVEHRSGHCTSHQNYRGVVDQRGTAVFDGIVRVHRDAQKTEAHQQNRNLLLSDTANAFTKPHLEIDADDVVCSHGATVGSLDSDQLFYLRTRGLSEDTARAMLTQAFVASVVDTISDTSTRERLSADLIDRLPSSDQLQALQ